MNDNKSTDALTGREIAVIGMAGHFPGSRNLKQFWQNLRDGVEVVKFFSDEELLAAGEDPQILRDPHYVKAGSVLEEVEMFDASFFGYNAREAEIMDPQQRLFLEHSWHALEDAGYTSSQYEGLIGVYAGVAWNTYLLSNLSTRLDLFEGAGGFQVFIANDKDFMPTRLSYKLNLRGPSVIIQTSCSTSLVAVHLACLSLLNYECDLALAGGATIKVPHISGYFHQEGGLASPDGHCRAFDARAAGTIFGSGIGVVVLKRLSEALEDGDTIRAIIKGTAVNNDGSAKVSYTAPSVEGQAEVIAAAQAIAGVSPETIQYIETHGTGTSLGDPVEITAISKVFSRSTRNKNFCGIGSVKTNVGHLDAAAGVAGLIKTILALENKELPPSLNFEQPNPAIQFENTPFYVNSSLRTWERNGVARRAGVSSFGVGGTNAHAILEEAPQRHASGPSRPLQLLTISARTSIALERVTSGLAAHLAENPNASLPDLAYTLKAGRNVFRHRRILVCSDGADALKALESTNSSLLTAVDTEDPRERPVIFMFSGQGSQYVNMGRDLFENEAVFRENLYLCAKLLKPHLGFDLLQVLFPGAGEEEKAGERLERTETTQPALFALEYSLALLWMHWGIAPQAMIGHSIGEYVAAALAGVMSLEEALELVAARGKLMQQQPAGKMLAIQLPEEEILPLLTRGLALAAVNGPSSSVVSGPAEEIEGWQQELTKNEIESRALHTSHAFHSGMMDSMLEPFIREVKKVKLQPPAIPFISNLTGTWITPEQATDPKYWALHLRSTVRFSQGMQELLQNSERIFLEVGPGRSLATVTTHHPKRTGQVVLSSLRHPKEDGRDFARLLESLGRLWMAGLKIDWRKFYQGERRHRVPLPLYPFERQRYWIDPLPRTAQRETGKPRTTVGKKPDISDWFYLPSWTPTLFPAPAEEQHRSWLVMADGCGFGERLAAELAGDDRRIVTAKIGEEFCRKDETNFVLRPGNKEDYLRLLEELRDRDQSPEAIVHAWSLSADGARVRKFSEFEEYQSCSSYSLLFLVQALSKFSDSTFDLSVVSNHVERPVAGERLHPEKAPMLGLCRVAAQEISNIRCRLIDVALPAPGINAPHAVLGSLALRVRKEIESRSNDQLIVLTPSQRWIQAFEAIQVKTGRQDQVPLREHGVYVLTGGLQGNGFLIARFLAKKCQARLVLLEDSTSPVPDEKMAAEIETARTGPIEELKELGAEVLVMDLDLTQESSLAGAWDKAESRWGAVHGLIHALEPAGEDAFRALSEMELHDFALHFRPKVHAVFALSNFLEQKKLDFRILVSSLAAVLGGIGYGGYAAANLFMDAFAREYSRSGETPWISVGWDLWLGEQEANQITQVRGDLSDLAMSTQEGEEALNRVLYISAADQILVSTADLSARIERMTVRIREMHARKGETTGSSPVAVLHPRPPLPSQYIAPETGLEKQIAAMWQQALGFEAVGIDDNFFELGGDSLIAIQVATRLKQELKLEFPVAKLYQRVTVRTLAHLLAQDEGNLSKQLAAGLIERKEQIAERKELQKRMRSRRKVVGGLA